MKKLSNLLRPSILERDMYPVVAILVDALFESRQFAVLIHFLDQQEQFLVAPWCVHHRLDVSGATIHVVTLCRTPNCLVQSGAAVSGAHYNRCAPRIAYRLQYLLAERLQIRTALLVRRIVNAPVPRRQRPRHLVICKVLCHK